MVYFLYVTKYFSRNNHKGHLALIDNRASPSLCSGLYSQHGFPFMLFFLLLPSPVTWLQHFLRNTGEKKNKLKPSGLIRHRKCSLRRGEMKGKQRGWVKKSKIQHRSTSGLWHRKRRQFIWTLKKRNLRPSKINFPLKMCARICLFLLSQILQWSLSILSREEWKNACFVSH